jgi:hypothetical protein
MNQFRVILEEMPGKVLGLQRKVEIHLGRNYEIPWSTLSEVTELSRSDVFVEHIVMAAVLNVSSNPPPGSHLLVTPFYFQRMCLILMILSCACDPLKALPLMAQICATFLYELRDCLIPFLIFVR